MNKNLRASLKIRLYLNSLVAILLVAIALFGNSAAASPALKQEFASTYYTHYQAGRCGENTAALAQRARAQGVDLSQAHAVVITNEGYMLTTTHRRDSGEKLATPVNGVRFGPGIANFYFHVVLMKDGEIYDFDFGIQPEVMSVKDYIRRMFWEEPAITQYKMMDRLDLRKKYKIAFVPLEQYLREMNATGVAKQNLADYFDSL